MRYLLPIIALITIGLTTLVSMPDSPYLIGGMTQADISAMFSTAVTPAGFTFAIWSLIYLSWILAWVYVAFFQERNPKDKSRSLQDDKSIAWFSLAILLTFLWLIPWGYLWIGTSLTVMLTILALLVYVFSRTRDTHTILRSSIEITLGWIIMATALNVTVWIRYMGWSIGWPGDFYYAIVALGVILLIVSELQCRYRTYILSWVFLWTLLWVYIAHPQIEIRWATLIFAVTIAIYIIQSLRDKKTSLSSLKFW
jgi:translocator protein